MQGIYNYIPETTRDYILHTVAAVLYSQSALHVMLFPPVQHVLYLYISTFCSLCAVHNMAGFCNSLFSYFPAMLFRYGLYLFVTVPVALLLPVSLLLSHSKSTEFLL